MIPSGLPSGVVPARLRVRAQGVVQGVGFRYFVRREALRLGLSGWVANRSDGSVEACAEGPANALERLAEALSVGPPGASVTDLEVQWGSAMGDVAGFVIRSGSHSGD